MSTYKKEIGTAVQNNAGDYTGAVEGQLWYNSTDASFQFRLISTAGAWSTGGSLNTARINLAGSGTQTAGLAFGGSPPDTGVTESYDGTSWTELNDLNTARGYLAGAGTQTSAIAIGGYIAPPGVGPAETWNGTSWTAVANLNTGRFRLGGAGADNTSALAISGELTIPGTFLTNVESWNGSAWTEVNDVNTAVQDPGANGTVPSALKCGGQTPGQTRVAITESWNGTSWTEVNDLNTARSGLVSTGVDNTSALAFGGNTPTVTGVTELYNGTSWSEQNDLSTARNNLAGAGTTTAGLAFGGSTPPATAATEEFSYSDTTFTVG